MNTKRKKLDEELVWVLVDDEEDEKEESEESEN